MLVERDKQMNDVLEDIHQYYLKLLHSTFKMDESTKVKLAQIHLLVKEYALQKLSKGERK